MEEFNTFRENYDSLTFSELKTIQREWYKKYPNQRRFDREFILSCVKTVIGERVKVIELGGHNGQLALEVLKEHPKIKWLNVEIIEHDMANDLENYDYKEYVLSKQMWEEPLNIEEYDFFISSHMIEGIKNKQLIKLLNRLIESKIKYIILQAPIKPEGQTWDNYFGAHILEMGSKEIKNILGEAYHLIKEEVGWCAFWRRSDLG